MPAQHDGANVYGRLAEALSTSWRTRARPEQLAPTSAWSVWLILAGRGFGKTRTLAEWVHESVAAGRKRVAIVAPTAADVRDVLVEGESGILSTAPRWARPDYEPSKRRLTWPSGAIATCYSADEPERLRGPQHDAAACDELGAWRYPEQTWAMLMMGLRLGANPQCAVATTPKPVKLIRELLAREGRDVVVTRGRTADNAANLAAPFLSTILARYEGTRLGRQELEGELLDDVPGALWQRDWLDRDRLTVAPELSRIVVAIDPAATSGDEADETGIVVAGRGVDGRGYVLDDLSGRYAPHEWARVAISAYRRHSADRIVAEVNNGGEMVGATLRSIDAGVPFKSVHASRGKVTRAEPISALYEQGKVSHVEPLSLLEDQLCAFTSDFDRSRAGYSPDRVDALVWALTELMVGPAQVVEVEIGAPIQVGAGASTYSSPSMDDEHY